MAEAPLTPEQVARNERLADAAPIKVRNLNGIPTAACSLCYWEYRGPNPGQQVAGHVGNCPEAHDHSQEAR